uniref:Tf2-1-like SH3-like domain-containing protein n=1 Tax=Ananas comosus var. bracteatus TaxID=296719 RepID=A0A6V7PXZ8_ANACO|nr:unnamed protein product [Ananas comosus var. bracteatus]
MLWSEVGERLALGPDVLQEAEDRVCIARERLLTAQSRQKSYADKRRRNLEFQIGDHVFLKVLPTREIRRFEIRGKLSPQYIGPYEILERVGPVANRLALPPNLSGVHNIFHVSVLRKYVHDSAHVLDASPLELRDDLSFEEQPLKILAREVKRFRNRDIPYVKRHDDWVFETLTTLACHLCSFAHACEGRSLQAGTPELAYATYVRSCGIQKLTGSSGTDTFQSWDVGLPQALRRHNLDYLG